MPLARFCLQPLFYLPFPAAAKAKPLHEMEQTKRRYSPPTPDVSAAFARNFTAYSKQELRALVSLGRDAEQELSSRPVSLPSSLAPQIVMSWLPRRGLASALRVSSTWRGASEPVFHIIAQRHGLSRERADIPWREVVRLAMTRVIVTDGGLLYSRHEGLAKSLGVLHEGWVKGFGSYDSHDQDDCLRDGDAGEFIAEVNNTHVADGAFIHAVAFRLNRNGHIYIVARTGLKIGIHNEYRHHIKLTTVA